MSQETSPFNVHEFCETLRRFGLDSGGSAFRTWCALYFHRGVFIGFHNHDWIVCALSDPSAKWSRGCQHSACNGDPWPQVVSGKLLGYGNRIPSEIQSVIDPLVTEAVEIMRVKIEEHKAAKVMEEEAVRQAAKRERDAIVSAWK